MAEHGLEVVVTPDRLGEHPGRGQQCLNNTSTKPSPRNLPRKGVHSDPGIPSVISLSPASRSRHTSSPAKKTTRRDDYLAARLGAKRSRQLAENLHRLGDQRDAVEAHLIEHDQDQAERDARQHRETGPALRDHAE